METEAGGQVVIQIRMVHHVESPEDRDGMKHDVLYVYYKIEEDHAGRHCYRIGDVQGVQQPPVVFLYNKGHGHRHNRHQQLC